MVAHGCPADCDVTTPANPSDPWFTEFWLSSDALPCVCVETCEAPLRVLTLAQRTIRTGQQEMSRQCLKLPTTLREEVATNPAHQPKMSEDRTGWQVLLAYHGRARNCAVLSERYGCLHQLPMDIGPYTLSVELRCLHVCVQRSALQTRQLQVQIQCW